MVTRLRITLNTVGQLRAVRMIMMIGTEDNNNHKNNNAISSSTNFVNPFIDQPSACLLKPSPFEVPTDDDDLDDGPDQITSDGAAVPSTMPPARRVVLLKRPNIPRGHSPASASEILLGHEAESSIAPPSASSPALYCEAKDLPSSEEVGESSYRSSDSSRFPESGLAGPVLTLEQREQAVGTCFLFACLVTFVFNFPFSMKKLAKGFSGRLLWKLKPFWKWIFRYFYIHQLLVNHAH